MKGLAVRRRSGLRVSAIVAAAIALSTLTVAVLELGAELPDASSVYLVAVVVSGIVGGTRAALVAAVVAVVTYDLLFTQPFLEPTITDEREWLSLVVLSFVGVTVGQLVASQHRRTRELQDLEREARDLYAVSRALATRTSTLTALGDLAETLRDRAGMQRVWFTLAPEEGPERTVADTGIGPSPSGGGTMAVLRRRPGEQPGDWVIVHDASTRPTTASPGILRHRVWVEAGGVRLGSLWGTRDRTADPVDAGTSRLLAAVADQVGQAIRQDRLAAEAAEAAVARQGSALKSALVESVSHDLRTPLAAIRAAAGTLMDTDVRLETGEVTASGRTIDREAQRLDRIVTNLLDLGRIEGGTLRASREAVELGELVHRAVVRSAGLAETPARAIDVAIDSSWADADPVLLEQAVVNVLENALTHTPPGTAVRVTAHPSADGTSLRLSIEDAGPGVPDGSLPRLFDKFYRSAPQPGAGRPGTGLGLAIVRGFVEAMGGRVTARRSSMGGLAVDLDLAAAHIPAEMLEDA